MQITKIVVRSFTIMERTTLNTDTLDPSYLQFVCETLARARASLSPLQIIDDPQSPTYLGLGWPEGISSVRVSPNAQQLMGQYFAQAAEPDGTLFYLQREGSGPVYAVLPAEQEYDNNQDDFDGADGNALEDDLIAEMQLGNSEDLPEKLARFDTMWEEALASVPVVLQFGPSDWGENWDDYAMYIATAILLDE